VAQRACSINTQRHRPRTIQGKAICRCDHFGAIDTIQKVSDLVVSSRSTNVIKRRSIRTPFPRVSLIVAGHASAFNSRPKFNRAQRASATHRSQLVAYVKHRHPSTLSDTRRIVRSTATDTDPKKKQFHRLPASGALSERPAVAPSTSTYIRQSPTTHVMMRWLRGSTAAGTPGAEDEIGKENVMPMASDNVNAEGAEDEIEPLKKPLRNAPRRAAAKSKKNAPAKA